MRTTTGSIGIEHTQLFTVARASAGATVPQAQENLQDRVLAQAKQLHDRRGGPLLWLYVDFNRDVPLAKGDVAEVAARLAALVEVADRIPVSDRWRHLERWRHERRYPGHFPAQIDQISFKVVDQPGFVLWGVSRTAFVPRITCERVRAEIAKKEEKLAGYKSCDVMWLLLVSGGGAPSSHFSVPAEVADQAFSTRFARVFYFENFTGKVLQLRTVSPDVCQSSIT